MASGMRLVSALVLILAVVPGVQAVGTPTMNGPDDACASAGQDPGSVSVDPQYCVETGVEAARKAIGG